MKRFLILITTVFLFSFVSNEARLLFAGVTTRDIELHAEVGDQPVRRSVSPIHAWSTNEIVYVSFLSSPNIATITIIDNQGKEIASQVYQYPQIIAIPLLQVTGECIIRVSFDEKCFVGEFTLE